MRSGQSSQRKAINLKTRAFTLIELLVVIAIIALLIAIYLPVAANSKKAGQNVVCLTNLKQLATDSFTYSLNNKDCIPYSTDSVVAVATLQEPPKTWLCPANKSMGLESWQTDSSYIYWGYFHMFVNGTIDAHAAHEYFQSHPTDTLFIDGGLYHNKGRNFVCWGGNVQHSTP